jgi:hypothetical protein
MTVRLYLKTKDQAIPWSNVGSGTGARGPRIPKSIPSLRGGRQASRYAQRTGQAVPFVFFMLIVVLPIARSPAFPTTLLPDGHK